MRRSSAAPSPEEEDRREPDENKESQKDATDKEMKVRHVDSIRPCPVVLNGWSRLAERADAHDVLAAPPVRQASSWAMYLIPMIMTLVRRWSSASLRCRSVVSRETSRESLRGSWMSPSALPKSGRAVSGWSLHRRGLRATFITGMTAVEARDSSCTVVLYTSPLHTTSGSAHSERSRLFHVKQGLGADERVPHERVIQVLQIALRLRSDW